MNSRDWIVLIDGKLFDDYRLGKEFTEEEADAIMSYYKEYAYWSISKYNLIDGREVIEEI